MRNLLIVLTVLLLYTCTCIKYQETNKCVELGGECVSIEKCDVLKQLIHKSLKDRDIVIKRICGFDELVAKVCCPTRKPNKCITPEGTMGSCVSIEKCSYLLQQNNSIWDDDIEYLHRSRCAGPARNSVCCDFMLDVTPNLQSNNYNNGDPQNNYNTSCTSANRTLGLTSVEKISNTNTCCGIESPNINKITGGEQTALDEFPWLAMLEYDRPYLCGGSLISSLYVLTAAHCLVTETKISRGVKAVRLGEYNTAIEGKDCVEVAGGGIDCTDGAVTITIKQIIVHPHYQSVQNVTQANDIGLLRLNKSAPYTDFIRPICLPSSDVTKVANLRLRAAGWGAVSDIKHRSDVKLQVDLPVVDQKICEEKFSINGKSFLWNKQFCAGGELDKDTCRGDSGGPLTYSDDFKKHQIVGITSFGNIQCGIQGRSSVFTNVIKYVPWILHTTKVLS